MGGLKIEGPLYIVYNCTTPEKYMMYNVQQNFSLRTPRIKTQQFQNYILQY